VIVHYDPNIEMKQALSIYFEKNAFGPDGGYNDAWVDFKLGPIPFPFPNTKGRVRAVRYHDLHHILTGYDTNYAGELEIAGWEIGAGCKDFVAAWVLNLGGMAGGLFRAPIRTFRAFVRGRHNKTFYGLPFEELLGLTVAEARRRAGTDEPAPRATIADALLFAMWCSLGLVVGLSLLPIGIALLPFGLLANLARPAFDQTSTKA
jgi:hypothetical protein